MSRRVYLVAGALIALVGCYSNNGGLIDLDAGVSGVGPVDTFPDGAIGGGGGDPGTGGTAGMGGGVGGMGGAGGSGGTAGTGGSGNTGGDPLRGAWQPAEVIDNHDSPGLNPVVAMNAGGRAVAAWVYFDVGSFVVRANNLIPVVGWGSDVDLGVTDGNNMNLNETSQPAAAFDAEGVGTVAWGSFSDPIVRGILSVQHVPVLGWGSVQTLYDGASTAGDPSLGTDENGNVVAGFSTGTGAWGNVFTPDDGWGDAAIIDNERNQPVDVRIAMHPNGEGWASWSQAPNGLQYQAFANRFTPGQGFGEAFRVDGDSVNSALEVELAASRNGDVLFVWQRPTGLRHEVWSSRWDAAEEALDEPARVSAGGKTSTQPAVAIDDSGRGTLVWLENGATSLEIWASRYTPGAGWGSPERLAAGDVRYEPRVAMDANGNAVVAYVEKVEYEDVSDVWARMYTGGGWGDPARLGLDERTGPAFQPAVAMDPNGTAVVVWREGPDVWAAVFD